MSVVRVVDKEWYDALIYYAAAGSLEAAARESNCSKPQIRARLDCGIACFKGVWAA
jgi:hypothetical protein